MLPRFFRDRLFRLAKEDVLNFLDDNQEEFIRLLREEMEKVDERMPEEQMFIDIHMAALGEELLRSVFTVIKRFVENY